MKNILITLCVISFFINIDNVSSQRNFNQLDFQNIRMPVKSEITEYGHSYSEYDYKINEKQKDIEYIKENEVLFEVKALMNVKASNFLAVFNLTQVGETAIKTDEIINSRIENFKNEVKQIGIKDEDIYVDMIYLIPTFEYQVDKKLFSTTYNEVPTGFEMQKNIHISFKDINKIDDLVTLAAKNEIYDLVKVDFFINDTESIKDSLREKAVNYLNKKLESFKKLSIDLSEKYHTTIKEVSNTIYPETQYSKYDAFVSQSFDAVKKQSGVTSIRKPKTVAYKQLPYNQFDIVINPEILEPVVQYVYKIKVKYTLDDDLEKTKNNYMLVTPNGDIKKLDVQ